MRKIRTVRVGKEEYLKPEQDAMLAEAREEVIKCFEDITKEEAALAGCDAST